MSGNIAIDPDKLEQLANDVVTELTDMENKYKDLHVELGQMILQCDPRYSSCFSGVGDAWSSGKALVTKLSDNEIFIRKTGDKFVEQDDILRKLYNAYDKYGTMTSLTALMLTQGKYYGLGLTKFVKQPSGLHTAQHSKLLLDISRAVDSSRYQKAARVLLNPKYLLKKTNRPFSDLVHKKFTKYFPQDTVDFSNSVRSYTKGFLNEAGVRSTLKDVGKTGLKFAKGNAITATLITGATETFGAGVKIAENYAKYQDKPEVLKRENAKAVGNAVNNTIFVAGGATAGAVIGGAIGSFAGPVGTVLLGAAGSYIGGVVGEQIAKYTAGFAEKAALKLKEPIHAVVDTAKKGLESAGKVVKSVNDGIDAANKSIHKGIDSAKKGMEKAKKTADSLIHGATHFLKGKFSFG
ncbi:hypothetical protein [Bacillus subtilis]|uniref:hypothetical protein n=1 Tax=Bacillus subtilis TaxID=1423 RepID=UPI001362DED6|nr:hypothetical protein [Bacillus subtilis]MEC1404666.1 hypothetical protein [Bacillus subtilis]QHM17617.1 hypothetical protein C7M30_01257 [Bacillus subtilis]